MTVFAQGRVDWTGWVDLVRDRITTRAIENTARVIREVDADIVGVVQAEDRITQNRFSDTLLATGDTGTPLHPHVMVIDGNDARAIDLGVLAKQAYPIQAIRSRVDDGGFTYPIFSRDCSEHWFTFPAGTALAGEPLVVLVNHLKSKSGGNTPSSVKKRTAQAEKVKAVYEPLRGNGIEGWSRHSAVSAFTRDRESTLAMPARPIAATTGSLAWAGAAASRGVSTFWVHFRRRGGGGPTRSLFGATRPDRLATSTGSTVAVVGISSCR